jgi:CheY-like chemotaxis protein
MATILYLEDEVWQVEGTVLTILEKKLGHKVTLVKSVEEATIQLSAVQFDVIVLDVMMDPRQGYIELEKSGLQIALQILNGEYSPAGNPPTMRMIVASGVWDATVQDASGTRWTVEEYVHSIGIPQGCSLRKPFLVKEIDKVMSECRR